MLGSSRTGIATAVTRLTSLRRPIGKQRAARGPLATHDEQLRRDAVMAAMRQDVGRYALPGDGWVRALVRGLYSHPSLLGVIWYRFGRAFWLRRRNPVWFLCLVLNRALYPLLRLYSGLELSPRAVIGPGLYVGHFGPTVIHPDVVAGEHLTLLHGVTLGVGTGGAPRLGDRVSIGTGAIVIGGIRVGNDATIGAGAVVTKDVADGDVVTGVPARSRRYGDRRVDGSAA